MIPSEFRDGPRGKEKRCPQCLGWQEWPAEFLGVRKKPVNWCNGCRRHYKGWGTKTNAEKASARAGRRKVFAKAGAFRVRWVAKSSNAKTGPIPITLTERGSCPDACSFRGNGCYAEEHNFLRYHWEKTSEIGLWWDEFLDRVEALPPGSIWRHNEAGDLPGEGNAIAAGALRALAEANVGRRGFTFTHKPLTPPNADAIRAAIALGFAINLSADSIAQADELAAAGVAPVSVVLPAEWTSRATKTPGGRTLVVCPAQTSPGMTCQRCRLCAVPDRKSIVGFRAHGLRSSLVSEIVRGRRKDDGVRDLPAPRPRSDRDRRVEIPARAAAPRPAPLPFVRPRGDRERRIASALAATRANIVALRAAAAASRTA
jgi:hypothetical protein